jgi:hypothetical protein
MISEKTDKPFLIWRASQPNQEKVSAGGFTPAAEITKKGRYEQGVMKTATINFPSRDSELRFKWVLGRVDVMAKVLRDKKRITLALRPTDMQNFRENLYIRGLAHCPVTNAVLQYLQENPTEFLQFQFRV